jgi:hypothetical protein
VQIERIFQEVDKLVFSIARMDINLGKGLWNKSVAIQVRHSFIGKLFMITNKIIMIDCSMNQLSKMKTPNQQG